jgi:hypothetical protein
VARRKGKSAYGNLPQRHGDTEEKKTEGRKGKIENGNPNLDLDRLR